MTAIWFQGPAEKFIEVSRAGSSHAFSCTDVEKDYILERATERDFCNVLIAGVIY